MTSKGKGPFCPECNRPATGNFCSHCGASLGGRFCNQCGTEVSSGAKFCNQCGAQVAAAGVRAGAHREAAASVFGGQNLAWWIAGAAMFALIVVVGVSMVRPGAGPTPGSTGGVSATPAATTGGAPDISSMTPIEAATRLYNRVMTAVSSGDSLEAQQFMPMAIAAYQRARPLDHDGLFHLSMLNRTAGNYEAALAQAHEILDDDPNHLLGRVAAAEAAVELGEMDEAETHYRAILDVYDEEVARGLPEYGDHRAIIDVLPDEAERFLAER